MKKIIMSFMIIYLSFNLIQHPDEVKAFDLVITPTVGAVLVVGTLLTAVGIKFATDEDMQSACKIAYSNMTNNIRDWVDNVSLAWDMVNALTIACGKSLWNEIVDWASGFAQKYNYQSIDGLGELHFVNYSLDDVSVIADFPVINTVAKESNIYVYNFGTTELIIELSYNGNYGTEVFFNFPNGNSLKGKTNNVGTSGTTTRDIRFFEPVVTDYYGYRQLRFGLGQERWDGGGWSYSYYYPSSWYINGSDNSIYVSNGRVKSNYQYYTDGSVYYNNLSQFIYDFIVSNGEVINFDFVSDDMTSAVSIGNSLDDDESLTVNVPNTLEGARTNTQQQIINQTAPIEQNINPDYSAVSGTWTGTWYDNPQGLAIDFPNTNVSGGLVLDGQNVREVSGTWTGTWAKDGTWTGTLTDVKVGGVAVTDTLTGTIATTASASISTTYIPPEGINWQPLKLSAVGLTDKFPFCIPFDFVKSFSVFSGGAIIVPRWEIPMPFNNVLVFDLSIINPLAPLVRWFILILFNLGLIMVIRRLIS